MKKIIVVQLLLLVAVAARGAEFGSLDSGTYRVMVNGAERRTVETSDGVVSLSLPGGSQLIGLSAETQEGPLPLAESDVPSLSDYDQEVFLSSFDENTLTNRFSLLDRQGLKILEPVVVLEGANTEGKVLSTDLDGDGMLEVLAAGFIPEQGVVLEYWTGDGNLILQINVFETSFNTENHLVSINLDGAPGNEAMLIGRDPSGAYHVKTFDAAGDPLNEFVAFAGDYERIDSILAQDVDGDGRQEAALLVRTLRDTVEMKVLGGGTVLSSTPLFGSGFAGVAALFPIDLDGDGQKEIGAARKSVRSNSHRLTVADWNGNILLKTDVLSGKYEEVATFCAADVDSNGGEEIGVVGRLVETGANILEIVNGAGEILGTREVLAPSFNGDLTTLCADLNGDSAAEIVVGGKDSDTQSVAYQVVGKTGEAISGGAFFESGVDYQAALFRADIDMDGDQELLAVGEFKDGRYGLEMRDGSSGLIRFTANVWETPMELAEGELVN